MRQFSKLISGFISSLTSFFYVTLFLTSLLSLQLLPKQLWNLNVSSRRLRLRTPSFLLQALALRFHLWISSGGRFMTETSGGVWQGRCLGLGQSPSPPRTWRQGRSGGWLRAILKLRSDVAGREVLSVVVSRVSETGQMSVFLLALFSPRAFCFITTLVNDHVLSRTF